MLNGSKLEIVPRILALVPFLSNLIVSNELFGKKTMGFYTFLDTASINVKIILNYFFRQQSSIFSVSEGMETAVELGEGRAIVDRRERMESGGTIEEGVESVADLEDVESVGRKESVESEESDNSWSGLASPHCPCWVVYMAWVCTMATIILIFLILWDLHLI